MTCQKLVGFRTYDGAHPDHAHDYVQLILPVMGGVEVELEGKGAHLDINAGALFAAGAHHAQGAQSDNRVLFVNLMDEYAVTPGSFGSLEDKGRFEITPAIRHLIAFILEAEREGRDLNLLIPLWIPLLSTALSTPKTLSAVRSRLHKLLSMMDAAPGDDFSVARMAAIVGVSPGRFHAVFQAELGCTPRAYLADIRMRRAIDMLSLTSTSISDVALELGFSDQSALTRAMRRMTGNTPGAIRHRSREFAQNM